MKKCIAAALFALVLAVSPTSGSVKFAEMTAGSDT